MRRRDYELIAQAIKDARPLRTTDRSHDTYVGWHQTVVTVGIALNLDNAGFSYQLWLHNCGVES